MKKKNVKSQFIKNTKPSIEKFDKLETLGMAEDYSSNGTINESSKLIAISPPNKNQIKSNFFKTKSIQKFSNAQKPSNDMHHIIDMGDEVLYVGIIDTLTNFGSLKKVEFGVKIIFQGSGISCYPPNKYQKRFSDFMQKVFTNQI